MDVYIYQADLHCEACGKDIIAKLTAEGKAPADPSDEHSFDSDDFPKGPIMDGGGESDSPCHCATCGVWLENDITTDGYNYLYDAIAEFFSTGHGACAEEWIEGYNVTMKDMIDHAKKIASNK